MKSFFIPFGEQTDAEEFRKSIGFVSCQIQGVMPRENGLDIFIEDTADEEELREALFRMMRKFKKSEDACEVYFSNPVKRESYFSLQSPESEIIYFGDGQIGFNEKGNFLMNYLDARFADIAVSLGATEKIYPALLPVFAYSMTGYVRKSPQYAVFCSSVKDSLGDLEATDEAISSGTVRERIKEPQFALSPSACFHTYLEYRNKVLEQNTVVTFKQNVFRNEGRLNYDEIGRLCDYHVREIVMIGSLEYVVLIRDEIMKRSVEILRELGLKGDITLASDSFVIPKMQMYRKIQRIDKSKYEMHLHVSENHMISTASFNLHGKAFTDPFCISVKDCEDTVTACVGFGLQRWVLAFFAQYGFDVKNWPERVAAMYEASK